MKPNYAALLRHKISNIRSFARILYYKFLGMRIGKNASVGRIECSWPNKISIGISSVVENNVAFKTPQPFTDTNFIKIGDRTFIGHGCNFNITLGLTIGNDCMISSDTTFVDAGREINRTATLNQQPVTLNAIDIADDVWIGAGCVILQGVIVGRGSIVGAGSIVNKPIPEFQVWAGSPARFIKNR